jgi:hypothetical protein
MFWGPFDFSMLRGGAAGNAAAIAIFAATMVGAGGGMAHQVLRITPTAAMHSLHLIDEPAAQRSRRFALWQTRLSAVLTCSRARFAALSIPLWALQFAGVLHHPYLAGPLWHAHEMLFGFALAVIVGFLFTAGRNWSNQATPSGATLAALAGCVAG